MSPRQTQPQDTRNDVPQSSGNDSPINHFHPAVSGWFNAQFSQPTPPQLKAWAAIAGGGHACLRPPAVPGKPWRLFWRH